MGLEVWMGWLCAAQELGPREVRQDMLLDPELVREFVLWLQQCQFHAASTRLRVLKLYKRLCEFVVLCSPGTDEAVAWREVSRVLCRARHILQGIVRKRSFFLSSTVALALQGENVDPDAVWGACQRAVWYLEDAPPLAPRTSTERKEVRDVLNFLMYITLSLARFSVIVGLRVRQHVFFGGPGERIRIIHSSQKSLRASGSSLVHEVSQRLSNIVRKTLSRLGVCGQQIDQRLQGKRLFGLNSDNGIRQSIRKGAALMELSELGYQRLHDLRQLHIDRAKYLAYLAGPAYLDIAAAVEEVGNVAFNNSPYVRETYYRYVNDNVECGRFLKTLEGCVVQWKRRRSRQSADFALFDNNAVERVQQEARRLREEMAARFPEQSRAESSSHSQVPLDSNQGGSREPPAGTAIASASTDEDASRLSGESSDERSDAEFDSGTDGRGDVAGGNVGTGDAANAGHRQNARPDAERDALRQRWQRNDRRQRSKMARSIRGLWKARVLQQCLAGTLQGWLAQLVPQTDEDIDTIDLEKLCGFGLLLLGLPEKQALVESRIGRELREDLWMVPWASQLRSWRHLELLPLPARWRRVYRRISQDRVALTRFYQLGRRVVCDTCHSIPYRVIREGVCVLVAQQEPTGESPWVHPATWKSEILPQVRPNALGTLYAEAIPLSLEPPAFEDALLRQRI